MEWLFIIALAAGGAWLKLRLDGVERRSRLLEEELEGLRGLLREQRREVPRKPAAAPQVSVPKVRIARMPSVTEDAPPPAAPLPELAEPSPATKEAAPIQAEPEPDAPARPAFRFDFEDIFGRRLPIWAGGVTLAVAGVLLVRYSIEAALLTEPVRVALAFLFGLALIAAAEIAHRNDARIRDPRVPQALAGAGLATLYAGFYLAGSQYGLIGQGFAFLGLASVTAAAIALSFRFGLPAAILGLVGGFAAPALVGGEEANLPLLALYLGLVTAGLSWTGRRQKRAWLGMAALIGGLGWGGLMLLTEEFGSGDILALGLYFAVLGAVLPALTEYGRFARLVRLGGAALASLQLAALVEKSLHDPLSWGLYLLLGGALAVFAWKRRELREASAIAAAIGVALLGIWHLPYPPLFALVAAAVAGVFAGVPVAQIAQGDDTRVDVWTLAAVPLGIAFAALVRFCDWSGDPVQPQLALAMAGLALLPAGGAWLVRARADAQALAAMTGSAGLLSWFALLLVTPGWAAPLAMLPVFGGVLAVIRGRNGRAFAVLVWSLLVLGLLALGYTPEFGIEHRRLAGIASEAPVLRALLRWSALGAMAAGLAFILPRGAGRMPECRASAALAALLAYGALAQILPPLWLAPVAAALALASRFALPRWTGASSTLLAIALLWAVQPLGLWVEAVLGSLTAYPVLVDDLPGIVDSLLRLLAPAAALAAIAPPMAYRGGHTPLVARAVAGALGLVALHILFKQVFALDTITRFEALGMAERTVWQGLLVGSAWAVRQVASDRDWARPAALALAAAGLAHYALYSLALHNPLWTIQAVGPTPLANLVLAAAAIAVAGAILLRRLLPSAIAPALDAAIMVVVSVAAIALLRQIFAGSVLPRIPLGATEDLLRSLVGIVLALAFLAIGARRGERSWRIGSLAAMLIAVVKVFLFDAAGLEGLVRIASFLALGVSLIAIGWFYARVLSRGASPIGDSEPILR